MKNIGVFWWKDKVNFGDILSRDIISHFNLQVFHKNLNELSEKSACCIGSILNWVPETFDGYILGSGIMRPVDKQFSNAKIIGLRGEMTRQVIKADKNIVLGDPGLLSSVLWDKPIAKKFVLGLIPHFEHQNDPIIKDILDRYPDDILLIDVMREPIEVLKDITQCTVVMSSSLHGIVVADAFGIPCGWFRLEHVAGGGLFKFQDYGTAIDDQLTPLRLTSHTTLSQLTVHARPTPEKVEEVKFNLSAMFKRIYFEI